MKTILTIVLLLSFPLIINYLNNRICFAIGKVILRILTLNRYPGKNPDEKQVKNSSTAGFIAIFITVILLALIKTYFYP